MGSAVTRFPYLGVRGLEIHPFGAAGPEQILGGVADPDQSGENQQQADEIEQKTPA